jgi:WhiB family transcriptional regulator, redox-sensing transcriptional regulator
MLAAVELYEALLLPDLPAVVPPAPRWQRHAACAGADVAAFYPERGVQVGQARALCRRCPVADVCLRWAVEHDEYGLWGGTTREERKAMERRRAA